MTDRLAQLTKLHELDPKDPFCTYGIAMEHAKAGRRHDAIQWFEKTLTIDPGYCYAYYHKAKVLEEAGDAEQARAVLQAGIDAARKASNADAAHAAQEMRDLLDSFD